MQRRPPSGCGLYFFKYDLRIVCCCTPNFHKSIISQSLICCVQSDNCCHGHSRTSFYENNYVHIVITISMNDNACMHMGCLIGSKAKWEENLNIYYGIQQN